MPRNNRRGGFHVSDVGLATSAFEVLPTRITKRREAGKKQMVQVPYGEGVANRIDPSHAQLPRSAPAAPW
jgi:hypothetical protein